MSELFSGFLPTLLLFFIPGAVFLKISDLLRDDEPKMPGERLGDIFLWSLVNWGLNTPLFYLARLNDITFERPAVNVLFAAWTFVLCPALVALFWSKLRAHQPQSRATARAFPTGWDFFFARRQACWVVCHFANGQKVGGYFGPNSSATSFPREPELFLEEIWSMDDDGHFLEKLGAAGAVVRASECLWIEFFDHDAALKGQLLPARPAGQLWRDANGNAAFSYAPAATQTASTPPQRKIEAPEAPFVEETPVESNHETNLETNHYEPETLEIR